MSTYHQRKHLLAYINLSRILSCMSLSSNKYVLQISQQKGMQSIYFCYSAWCVFCQIASSSLHSLKSILPAPPPLLLILRGSVLLGRNLRSLGQRNDRFVSYKYRYDTRILGRKIIKYVGANDIGILKWGM